MQKLSHNDHIDLYRHLSFCAVGGFFGCYAVLIHSGVMGNAQTVNLIELLLDALRGDLHAVLLHLSALVLYVLGTMLTGAAAPLVGLDMHYVSPVITAAAAVAVAFLPETLNVVVALYPIFFAMSIQWSSFGGARGFTAPPSSPNNTKQTSLRLANYLCDHDRAHLRKLKVFALTLLCFHIARQRPTSPDVVKVSAARWPCCPLSPGPSSCPYANAGMKPWPRNRRPSPTAAPTPPATQKLSPASPGTILCTYFPLSATRVADEASWAAPDGAAAW